MPPPAVGWRHQPGRDGQPAIAEPGRHDRELQRRGRDEALADAADQGLALLPALAQRRPLPLGGRDQPGLLAGQVDAELPAQPETGGHRGDGVDADPAGHVVEVDVAGLAERLDHGDPAVAVLLPAVEPERPRLMWPGQKTW